MNMTMVTRTAAICLVLGALAACGGSRDVTPTSPTPPTPPTPPATFTIGGTLSGLTSGAHVVLQNNGGDALTVSANGSFTFATALASGAAYSVTVSTQPAGETCTAASATGTLSSANVTNVVITCAVTAAPTYTVGGTVSGLTGTAQVTITLNGGANLAAGNGSFVFATTLLSGASYAVAIVTQPAGETCTLSNASGTIGSADISNVLINCTSSGGGSGTGSAFWLPFSAVPVAGTTGGNSGLFLIASTTVAQTPAPTPNWVTTSVPTLLGFAVSGFISGSTLPTSQTPALIMYAAAGTDGNTHIYGLNLAYTSSTPPVPIQITNLSVPATMNVCNAGQMENNVATPASLAVVFYVVTPTAGATPGTAGYCPAGGTYELANYSDSPTTAPTVLAIPGGTSTLSALLNDGPFTSIYQNSGLLAGVVLWDATSKNLNLYEDESFVAPSALLSGVSQPVAIFSRTVQYGAANLGGGNYLFNASTASVAAAYRINASLTPSEFFAGSVGSAVADDSNLYFIGSPGSSTTQSIYKEPLSFSGSATQLFSGLPAATGVSGSQLVWSNDSALVFENYSASGAGETYSLLSIPVGAPSTSATTIAGPIAGELIESFMASPTGTDTASDILFLTTLNQTSSGSTVSASYSSQVLAVGGTVMQTTPNSLIGSFGTLTTELNGDVWEVQGITDTNGGYGGGTLKQLNVGTLAASAMTTSAGAAYIVPAGYGLSFTGFYGTNIAVGGFVPLTSPTAHSIGAAVDVSQHAILPLDLTNTNVTPML